VFAPNSKHRVQVTPTGRGKGSKICRECGGSIVVIASIELIAIFRD
jgi:hypothetical protein